MWMTWIIWSKNENEKAQALLIVFCKIKRCGVAYFNVPQRSGQNM